MNNKFEVFQIFPTPIYKTSLDREFLNVKKKIFFDEKNFLKPNIGNKTRS